MRAVLFSYANCDSSNYGEMVSDLYYESQGYTRVNVDRVTSLDDPGHHGIDGVYEAPKVYANDASEYIIVESKYSTTGTGTLGSSNAGKQMSEDWIEYNLTKAVGYEKAQIILKSGYDSILIHTAPDGTITVIPIDANGNKLPPIVYDE